MNKITEYSLWEVLEQIKSSLKSKRLADVFRFTSFYPSETYGPHKHMRIEINYVKKGNCILHIDKESINFHEGDIMIISPNVEHQFEAGVNGTILMQLEFLPEIFSHLHSNIRIDTEAMPTPSFLFSKENRLIKIVNNINVTRTVQRIINELEHKGSHYQYLVVMYYAELLIFLYRYMHETYLSICTNDLLRKAICYIQHNYQTDINVNDIAGHASISERYLRKLFSQNLNLSPLDYLNQIRINKSIELLKNTEKSVKEVCFLCGFQSPQYFSRIFKQQIGLSPREIAKSQSPLF
ncbi:AraC family transcriptional regulator [Phocaeicola faecalis]